MKKNLLSLVSLIIVCVSATAQNEKQTGGIKFGVGGAIGLPFGTFKHIESMAYEGGVLAEFPESKYVNITGSVAYTSFTGKNGFTIDGGAVPILLGVKVKLQQNFYGHLQLGPSFPTTGDGGAAFTYSPSLGYQVSSHFDLSIRYFAATRKKVTESYLGLRFGYTF